MHRVRKRLTARRVAGQISVRPVIQGVETNGIFSIACAAPRRPSSTGDLPVEAVHPHRRTLFDLSLSQPDRRDAESAVREHVVDNRATRSSRAYAW